MFSQFQFHSFCVAVFICLFWPLICKWNHQLLNLAPCSPLPRKSKARAVLQAINSRPTSKASQVHLGWFGKSGTRMKWRDCKLVPCCLWWRSQILKFCPFWQILPISASCFLWVAESSFYPCQMKLEAIWKQGTSRQLEFKILLLPKVLSPGTLLLVKKVGKQPGYFVNFQSISLIRGSTETSVNSWIKSILNFHLNIFLYIKCFPQIRKTWT